MKDQHKHITGYRDMTQEEIDAVNQIKQEYERLSILLDDCAEKLPGSELEGRARAIAFTKLQESCMWAIRSIAKPTKPF